MRRTRLHRSLSLVATIVLLTLTACSGRAPAAPSADAAVAPQGVVEAAPAPAAAQNNVAAQATAVSPTVASPTNAPAPTPTRAPLPPTVVSVKPDRGEEQVISAPVVVTFDQPMDPASTSSAFSIEPKVPGEVKVSGNALTFSPTQRLERDKEYRVTLAATAASSTGLKMQRDVTFKFVTSGFLEVSSTQPANGASDVTVDSAITVAFNRPVVPLVAGGDQAGLPQPLVITPTVQGKGEWINTSMYRLTPSTVLAASTNYSVTVKAGLADTTGGVLEQPYTFTFRTIDPSILRWTPESNINVRIERPISVTFSMPMDKPSTEAAFSLLDPDKKPVAGTFNWNENATELGFKPNEVLKFGAVYNAKVALTAKAANGAGSLRQARDYVFSTVSLPRVTQTEPVDGEKSMPPDRNVRFVFASPMNPSTFVTGTVTVLPKPTRVMTYYNEYDGSLFVDFAKQPATAYTVTLSGKVADPYGNTLGKDTVLRFRTGDLQPLMQLNNQQQFGTYSAYTNTQAVVLYRNVPEITFKLYTISTDDLVRLSGKQYWEAWDKYTPGADNLVRQWTRKTGAPRNQSAYIREPLTDAKGNQLPPGVYYLTLGGAIAPDARPPRQLIVRTNANVTLKASANEALAWVTDLKSGLPLPGLTVRFTDGKNDVTATTGKDGLASVQLPSGRKPWEGFISVAGAANGPFGVASTNWSNGIGSWDFGLSGGAEVQPYQGYVYTDRPIYRPGQTVNWKAIIRRDNDARYALPAPGQPVTVTINNDQGNLILQQTQVLSPLGTVDGNLALGPDASTGYYYLNVRLSEEIGFGVGFQVAEYRKPEYEISAQTDKPEYSQGEQVQVTGQANYFFGGPVKNAKVSWVLTAADAPFDYKGPGYYSFSDFDWWGNTQYSMYGGMISQGTGKTDDTGKFTFAVPADVSKYQGSQRFTFDITVQDINNQAVSTQASAIVHKGEFYIGLAPRGYVLQTGQKGQVDVLTVDPQSKPVPNQRVELVVSQVEWLSVREKLEDGNYYWVTREKKTGVVTQTVTTDANGAAVLEWTPAQPGEYKVDATARDAKGNTIRSGAYVWVSGEEYVAWRQENNDRIKLVVDKDEYKVGDTAEVLIPSPYQGTVKALVTIERGRVIADQVIDLETNSQVLRLPITDEYVPNAFVSVTIVKGIDATSPAPSFKMGLAQFKVSTASRQLAVVVTPRTALAAPTSAVTGTASISKTLQVAPRSTVAWDVQTLDSTGKGVPADVSLALVDKAVLTLASDQAGKILDRFYNERSLGVQTGLTLALNIDRLVAQLAAEGKGGGGGGGGGEGLTVRTEFPDIAYWRASVQTDANGKATVQVTLPDNLTTWVMDARAATEDTRVGQSTTEVVATKDLLIRPVLPRFFTAGDKAEIAAVIHNTTNRDLDVTYNAGAQGLRFVGKTDGTTIIPAGGTYKAVWPVETVADASEVVVDMQATAAMAKLSDAVEITLPVERYSTPEVVGASGQVELGKDALELIRVPSTVDQTRGELDVNIEPSLAAGMLGGLTYLEHYPYECVEQTLSRFLPNVVTFDALKTLGVQRPDLDAKLPQQVAEGLQRLYARQHVDGGWGWWDNDKSNPAISAYVVFGLAKAKQADFTVDERVL
ncbi:MAG: Ig-like domain-containing protein, partial [Nitrososphaerales archaeon]